MLTICFRLHLTTYRFEFKHEALLFLAGTLILDGLTQEYLTLQPRYDNEFWGGLSFVNSNGKLDENFCAK